MSAQEEAKQEVKARCPKCGAEITYLKNYCFDTTVTLKFHVAPDGDVYYDEQHINSYEEEEFWCPACDAILTTDEGEAKSILMPP